MSKYDNIVAESHQLMSQEFSDKLNVIIQGQENSKFKIPVLGGMKAGKSTLLSKILSCDTSFLPPDVLEATARCVIIDYGFAACRKIVHANGDETLVETDSEWNELVRGLRPLPSDGDRLAVELPDEFLRQLNTTMCDTPGNNTVDANKEAETWAALSGSQVAIYCLRATEILTKSDIHFLTTALPQLKNFIIVITRVDEAMCEDANGDAARRLIDYAKVRLEETFSEKPIGVVAVSSQLPSERSGYRELKKLIENTLRKEGDCLRETKIDSDVKMLAVKALPELENKIALVEKAIDEGGDVAAERVGAFKGKLVETEGEKATAVRRLQVELANQRMKVRTAVSDLGRAAVERIRRRVEDISDSKTIEETANGLILSEADVWRNGVRLVVEQLAASGDEIMATAASEFTSHLSENVINDLHLESFRVALSDINDYSVSEAAVKQLEVWKNQREQIASEIGVLQREMATDAQQVPELQENLTQVRKQLEDIGEYEPQYVEKRYGDTRGETEDALKNVGMVADWVLLLAPIPMGKLKWLGKLKFGKQIKSVIKGANKLIRAKNKMVKRVGMAIPGAEQFLDAFSIEHWAGRLGHAIDASNVRTVMEEDREFKLAYEAQVAPFRQQADSIAETLAALDAGLKEKERLLSEHKRQAQFAGDEVQRIEQELEDQRLKLSREREAELVIVGRRQLVERAAFIFLNGKSELTSPVLAEIDHIFTVSEQQLTEQLVERMDATLVELRSQLEDFESNCKIDDARLKEQLNNLILQKAYLDHLVQGI